MSKKKKRKHKGGNWAIPKNAMAYFDPHYDDDFKARHPVLYWLTVIAIVFIVMIGPGAYIFLCSKIQPTINPAEFIFWLVGFIASFGISIGFCNLFMILHRQYLGHYVTFYSFAIGIVGSAVGLFFLWLI